MLRGCRTWTSCDYVLLTRHWKRIAKKRHQKIACCWCYLVLNARCSCGNTFLQHIWRISSISIWHACRGKCKNWAGTSRNSLVYNRTQVAWAWHGLTEPTEPTPWLWLKILKKWCPSVHGQPIFMGILWCMNTIGIPPHWMPWMPSQPSDQPFFPMPPGSMCILAFCGIQVISYCQISNVGPSEKYAHRSHRTAI